LFVQTLENTAQGLRAIKSGLNHQALLVIASRNCS
jgi:hypothetical protein